MILYLKHCDHEVLISSDVYQKIRCPICGTLVEPISVERLRRKKQIGDELEEGEIKTAADDILKVADKKFNQVKRNYTEATDGVLKELSLLTGVFYELYMYKAARNTARLLATAYLYRGYNREVSISNDLNELKQATAWFQATKDVVMESVSHLLTGRKALKAENCTDGIEYAKLLRIAIFEFNEACISQEPFSLKNFDRKYTKLNNEFGLIDEKEAAIKDVKIVLKSISDYAERNIKVAEKTLPEAVRAWGEVQKAKIMAEAMKYQGEVAAISIVKHGDLIRQGISELGNSIESGLQSLGFSVRSGLDGVAGGLHHVSSSIVQHGSMMNAGMNKMSKSILIGAGILGAAGIGAMAMGSNILSKSVGSGANVLSQSMGTFGGDVSSAIRAGAPPESQLTAFILDKYK